MRDKLRKIVENKFVIFCFILIISIIVFISYNNSKIYNKGLNAEMPILKASETTVPTGYTGIYNAEDLKNVVNNLSGRYILMADIDMTNETHSVIGATTSKSFSGIFDGNYHTIRNITVSASGQYVGIFGYMKRNSEKSKC